MSADSPDHRHLWTAPTSAKQHIESIVRESIQAINERKDKTAEVWTHFAPNCENRGDLRYHTSSWAMNNHQLAHLQRRRTVDGLVEQLPEANKHYNLQVRELTCTVLNEKAGFASVFVDCEGRGIPPGVVRRAAIWFEFRKFDGNEWKCVMVETLPGFGV